VEKVGERMIKRIVMYETVDGQVFREYTDAVEHDIKLNHHAYVSRLKSLESKQRAEKKQLRMTYWQVHDSGKMTFQSQLQRNVQERKCDIRSILSKLREEKSCNRK